jgi:predicted exporter
MTLSGSRKALVLIAWLGALAAALVVIVRSPFVADLSAFLPSNADETQQVLIDQLKAGTPARTLMVGIAGGDATARAEASRTLAAALRASGAFEQVNNGENDTWAGAGTWVFERRYLLSPAVTREHFAPDGLRAAIDDTLSLLGTPAGAIVKPLLERDPTGETQRIAEALIPAQAPRTEQGVWVGREAPRAVLMLVTRAAGADLDGQSAAIAAIRAAFEPLAGKGLTLQLSGPPKFSVDSRAQIEREIHWLAITGTLLMGALLLVAFGSPVALVAAFLPVGSGVLAGIATVSLGFGSVHGVTLGFGSTLIGEAVDYAIYYLIQARGHAAAAPGAGWRGWLASGWPTIRLGLLTSVCGFAALLFSGFPGLAQLGVFSIAGLFAAAATARFVLPVLLPDGTRGVGWRPQLGRAARAAAQWLPRSRWLWLALGLAAALTIVRHGELWEAELASLSPVPKEAIELDTRLRADVTSGDSGGLVVVQGPDAETVLQRTEAATTRLEALVEQRVLAGVTSVARFLPSQATQRERIAALPERAALRSALEAATRGGPLRAERLGPFVEAVEQARSARPETPESVRDSAVAPLIDALLTPHDDGRWTALLPVQPAGETLDIAAVRTALAGLPQTHVLEVGPELRRLYQRYLREARTQALLGVLGVIAIVAWSLRSLRRVLEVCRPLLLAVVITLGGLAALGVQLGILHLVGLLLIVAVGSNYALFFDLLHTRDDIDDDTLASLLLANLTTVAGFGLIAMSEIPALSAIGRVVGPGALLALLLAAAFAPRRRQAA